MRHAEPGKKRPLREPNAIALYAEPQRQFPVRSVAAGYLNGIAISVDFYVALLPIRNFGNAAELESYPFAPAMSGVVFSTRTVYPYSFVQSGAIGL